MNFGKAVVSGFRNSFNFSGRASRSEYWLFSLFFTLVVVASGGIADFYPSVREELSLVLAVIFLALTLPAIAVSVRRLHDINRTGWWVLITLTVIGDILLLVWFCTKGTAGRNRFGPDPLAGVSVTTDARDTAVVSGFHNCINFSGRASRSQFWFFLFVYFVLAACVIIVSYPFLILGLFLIGATFSRL
jgi:uncharacterized membrane protein YhaH (DUF805 family)